MKNYAHNNKNKFIGMNKNRSQHFSLAPFHVSARESKLQTNKIDKKVLGQN